MPKFPVTVASRESRDGLSDCDQTARDLAWYLITVQGIRTTCFNLILHNAEPVSRRHDFLLYSFDVPWQQCDMKLSEVTAVDSLAVETIAGCRVCWSYRHWVDEVMRRNAREAGTYLAGRVREKLCKLRLCRI